MMHAAWMLYKHFWTGNFGVAFPLHCLALILLLAFIQTHFSERRKLYMLRTRASRRHSSYTE